MDSLDVNKGIAAVLVAGIAFFVTGMIGDNLVRQEPLEKTVLNIQGAPAATTSGPPKEEPLPPIGPLLASADPAAGEALTKKVCVACHTFNQGGKAGVGPNLYGVVGAKHAHMEGFNYSAALKGKDGPWTYEELNQWLHKPSTYAPATRMSFVGLANIKQRADVIAYLRTLSANPEPLPAPEAAQPAAAPAAAAAAPAPAAVAPAAVAPSPPAAPPAKP